MKGFENKLKQLEENIVKTISEQYENGYEPEVKQIIDDRFSKLVLYLIYDMRLDIDEICEDIHKVYLSIYPELEKVLTARKEITIKDATGSVEAYDSEEKIVDATETFNGQIQTNVKNKENYEIELEKIIDIKMDQIRERLEKKVFHKEDSSLEEETMPKEVCDSIKNEIMEDLQNVITYYDAELIAKICDEFKKENAKTKETTFRESIKLGQTLRTKVDNSLSPKGIFDDYKKPEEKREDLSIDDIF